MPKGKFIVIEGIDSSGKATHTRLLAEFLKDKAKDLLVVTFPRYYTSEWGKLVGQYLTGEFGKPNEIDPHLSVLTYIMDQYTWSRDVARPWLAKGGWILSDRYFTSNVHQVAKLKTRKQSNFRNWLWRMGYDQLGILKPDLVVFIDRDPTASRKLFKAKVARDYLKGRRTDLAERDFEHQKASYKEYLRMVKNEKEWDKVATSTRGVTDPTPIIQERIRELILRKLF